MDRTTRQENNKVSKLILLNFKTYYKDIRHEQYETIIKVDIR